MDHITSVIVAILEILFDFCWNDYHVMLNLWQF